jgi:hypothetical protein
VKPEVISRAMYDSLACWEVRMLGDHRKAKSKEDQQPRPLIRFRAYGARRAGTPCGHLETL